jgi:hemoglobin/transferrin/lactoferrin receptor protein
MKMSIYKNITLYELIILLYSVNITYAQSASVDASYPLSLPEIVITPAKTEIVVTPTRTEKDVYYVPYTAYRLKGDESQLQEMVRTTPEVLKGIPSVLVQKTGQGQGSPFLRGFTGFRTLFLIDGIRLNNSVFRDGPNQYWNTVDPLSVRAYDLVMGPASVLYGSDAVGGTINALPITPPEYIGKSVFTPQLYYRGSTAEHSNVYRTQLGTRINEKFGFIIGTSIKDFGDVEGGKDVGRQKHTGYDENDYDARLEYSFGPDSKIILGHQTVNQDDAWRTHKTVYGITWEGLEHGNEKKRSLDQIRHLSYLQYKWKNIVGPIDRMHITFSRQVQKEDRDRIKEDDKRDKQGFDVTTWGSTLQLESDTGLGAWVYGIEFYYDDVESYRRKYNADGSLDKVAIQGPVADDAVYDSLGLYAQNTIFFKDGHFEVVTGARYTYSKVDADKVEDPLTGNRISIEDHWDAVVGSLRLLYSFTLVQDHVLFTGISQGFRAPNLSDLTRLDTARSNEFEIPQKDLDPEKFISYEIGIKSQLKRCAVQLTYYYTVIDDMIVRVPTGGIIDGCEEVTKKNAGTGYVNGLEFTASYNLTQQLNPWIAASWMKGKVDTYPTSSPEKKREYISRLMPPTAQLGVRWNSDNGKFLIGATCSMAAKADRLSTRDKKDIQRIPPGGTPGYAVFDINGVWNITDDLGLSLSLENILDKDYRIHGSGVNELGRNFIVTAIWRF